LKYLIRTTYFRGRGPQRIRRVILFQTANGVDSYGNGFLSGTEVIPNSFPSISTFIRGRIRDYTVRTIEPRVHTNINCPNLVSASILDFIQITENTINGIQRVQIKCYHVKLAGGILESGNIGAVTNGVLIPFEIEYTSHSGAEA